MKFTYAEKANAYGVGVYFLTLICAAVSILALVNHGSIAISIGSALFYLWCAATFNYRKQRLAQKERELQLSFVRSVLVDSLLPCLGFANIIFANSIGYLDLFSPVILVLTMIPMVFTNRKIQKLIVRQKKVNN